MLILLSILQTFSDFFHMLIVWLLGRTWFWNQTLCLSARLFIACVWVWMSNCLGLDIVNPSNHPPPPCLHLSTLCICWEQIAANGYIIQAFTSKRRWQMETVKVTWQMTVLRLHLWMHLKNVNVIVIVFVFVFFFVIVFVIVMIPTQKSNGELLVCIRNGDSWLVGVNFDVFWLCFCLCLCHCHCLFLTQKSNWKLLVCITNSDPGLADINVDVFWFSNLVPRILDTGHRKGGLENIEIACKCKYGNAKIRI